MTNPFRPTFGASPHYWAGRRIILDDYAEALASGPGAAARTLVITGSRGIGKTVLLNELEDIAATRGWVVLRASARGDIVTELIDSTVPAKIRELDPGTTRRITGVGITGLGSVHTSLTGPDEHDRPRPTLESRLRDLLALVPGTGVLVTVDEIQDADREALSRLAATYQNLIRDDLEVSLAMAGLTHGVETLLNLPGTTFMRRAHRYDLGPLTDADAADVLATSSADSGLAFDSPALAAAVDLAAGYPYLVQLVGSLAWNAARRKGAGTISTPSVEAVRQEAVATMGTQVHHPSLKGVPTVQREYLEAMAVLAAQTDDARDGPVATAAIAERLGKTQRAASDPRAKLIDRDLITPAGWGKVRFTLPYLGHWLRGSGTVRRVN
ncbi:ATP-binding protein [Corynebacterium sp.]|uniref:ATP-binding protein n=1 Tax=Corynebacterium sp. TaxID=1720 RepID=UPI0025BB2242|nr:ATP-binding protein [Corynebacterium sp.]